MQHKMHKKQFKNLPKTFSHHFTQLDYLRLMWCHNLCCGFCSALWSHTWFTWLKWTSDAADFCLNNEKTCQSYGALVVHQCFAKCLVDLCLTWCQCSKSSQCTCRDHVWNKFFHTLFLSLWHYPVVCSIKCRGCHKQQFKMQCKMRCKRQHWAQCNKQI